MQTFQLTDHFHIPRLLYEKLILQTISALVILYFPRPESILSRIELLSPRLPYYLSKTVDFFDN